MALVCRDPMSETHMTSGISREAYDKLMQLCAESGCSSNGHLGDKCIFFIDSCSYANVRAWGQSTSQCANGPFSSSQAFRDIRPPGRPYPYGDVPVSAHHSVVTLVRNPASWGVSIADLIARWPHVLTPKFHSEPYSKEFDFCVYTFMLNPWIRDHVCAAVALKCHGKTMTVAYLLRHIAVSMFYAVREKTTGLSDLDVFKMLMHVHLRQLVATGYSKKEKVVFVEVIWAESSLV
ncbi:hypothetical protein CCMSSC00406_0009461 [Pleurotus cornucopiae]|uniref:Uncharacterized protein n=1 Tax=Pleurotus cornucopiae TaxID=5321 RepID=A0ACB7J323_PLECO|nr:hypothetical protein CCMSSC00406_0009461 [Pleurotus cornucopiae]